MSSLGREQRGGGGVGARVTVLSRGEPPVARRTASFQSAASKREGRKERALLSTGEPEEPPLVLDAAE